MSSHTGRTSGTWPWKALGAPPPPSRAPLSLRTLASLQAAVMTGLAAYSHLHLGHRVMPALLVTLAALMLVGGWAHPPLYHAIARGGQRFGLALVRGLTWVLLLPFFYLCFVGGRVVLLLRGLDPMDRSFPDSRPSFWVARKPVRNMDQYRKQFG